MYPHLSPIVYFVKTATLNTTIIIISTEWTPIILRDAAEAPDLRASDTLKESVHCPAVVSVCFVTLQQRHLKIKDFSSTPLVRSKFESRKNRRLRTKRKCSFPSQNSNIEVPYKQNPHHTLLPPYFLSHHVQPRLPSLFMSVRFVSFSSFELNTCPECVCVCLWERERELVWVKKKLEILERYWRRRRDRWVSSFFWISTFREKKKYVPWLYQPHPPLPHPP